MIFRCIGCIDTIVLDMDDRQAEEIARNFLSQNYSMIRIEKSKLVNQTWIVEVLVSSFDKETIKKIKINNRTGSIIECE